MIYLKNECSEYSYEIEDVIKLFFRQQQIIKIDEPLNNYSSEALILCTDFIDDMGNKNIKVNIKNDSKSKEICVCSQQKESLEPHEAKSQVRKLLKRELYKLISDFFDRKLPWGVLTGIRPAKLVNEMLDNNFTHQQVIFELKDNYFVSNKKAQLLYEVAQNQRHLFEKTPGNAISLYIGIPFCPTRCLYCSFSSSTLGQYTKMVDLYVDTLIRELSFTASLLRDYNLIIESIYIGGGTPTSLNVMQLSRLLSSIEQLFDLSYIREYTLEAGRPDTIDEDKLKLIAASKVDRISINPQTMNNDTLRLIGRQHTAQDIISAYNLARKEGFSNINMDIISGLPGENVEMFLHTLKEIEKLKPDSLTVHTMSVKRASRLMEEQKLNMLDEQYNNVEDMVDLARQYAQNMELVPYYLYRQRNILGNQENIGYCRKGCESLYNIQIMEERQSIIACGAGGVSKVVFTDNRIERCFNVKSVEEYIARIEEMLTRKSQLIQSRYICPQ